MPRQTMNSFKGKKVLNFKKYVSVDQYTFQLDKNGQICDMFPRHFGVFNRLHNRSFNKQDVMDWLNYYED